MSRGPVPGANASAEGRPWGRALLWLVGLGVFFYTSYGFANWLASLRDDVPSIVFGWERDLPFLAWTIIPYWSVNLFYAASLFVCATRPELATHARRLLSVQIVAVAFFIATPLAFSFVQPQSDGLPGFMFAALNSFDRPYNQAPSLHIALLVVLWALYAVHVPNALRWLLHGWFALVGVSVLTTYQHHFIDIPTGALLGLLVLWVLPQGRSSPLARIAWSHDAGRRRIGAGYALAATGLTLLGIALGVGAHGAWLWCLYPAVSLALVAGNYLLLGPEGFQKDEQGRMSVAARLLLAPYIAGAWLNSRLWTVGQRGACEIADGVWLGRYPDRNALDGRFATVVDLTAELPAPATTVRWHSVPMLDLVAADPAALATTTDLIERARAGGPVLVVCALGYTRSAGAIALWLTRTGRVESVDVAIDRIRSIKPQVRLERRREVLQRAATISTGAGQA